MINLRKHVSIFSGDQIMPDIEEYFSVAEAAKKLDFTVQGVAKLIRQGKLEGKKVGNMWLVSKASVANYSKITKGINKKNPHRGKPQK